MHITRRVPPAARAKRRAACRLDHAQLDHDHLWHPFTQQQGWGEEEPLMIERGEGTYLIDDRGPPLPRRRLLALVQRPRPPPPGDRRGRPRAARQGRPLDHARPLPPRRRRAGRAAGRDRPARPHPRLLLGLRLDRGRGRAEDGLPVLAAARRPARPPHLLRAPARRLPRRHDRRGLGRRHRPLPRGLRAAAVRRPTPPSPATPADLRAGPRRARGGGRRGDRRAAGPGRGRDDRPPARLPARGARALRRATACC